MSPLSDRVGLPATFADHVLALLENEIMEGRLTDGQRVREVELAQMLGVSRTPVREALRTLERDGLVVRYRGRGTFIAPPLEAEEVRALYAVRLVLEPFLAGRAAARFDRPSLDAITTTQRDFRQVAEEIANASDRQHADVRRLQAADTKFHMTIYTQAGSALSTIVEGYWARTLRAFLDRLWTRSLRERPFLSDEDRIRTLGFADAHEEIFEALRGRDAEAASRLMREHIESGLLALNRQLDEEGVPT